MTTCPYCKSEKVGHNIGLYFVAYECHEENCRHQWIERFEVTNNDTKRESGSLPE